MTVFCEKRTNLLNIWLNKTIWLDGKKYYIYMWKIEAFCGYVIIRYRELSLQVIGPGLVSRSKYFVSFKLCDKIEWRYIYINEKFLSLTTGEIYRNTWGIYRNTWGIYRNTWGIIIYGYFILLIWCSCLQIKNDFDSSYYKLLLFIHLYILLCRWINFSIVSSLCLI